MPNSKQRRDAARRHLERQLVRRQQRDVRQRRITLVATVVGVLVLFGAVITTITVLSGHKNSNAAASNSATPTDSASPSASPTVSIGPTRAAKPIAKRAAKKTSGPCGYQESAATLSAGNLFDVGLPPDPKPTPTGTYTAVFDTNQGAITVTLDGKGAPCNVQSIK
ncbi:MAG: hypothetical protein ABI140_06265, partial [Jatrophihabitantaceae bacterium]